ncbi:CAP domain-containing protein [uncultured Tateyamaria sp.]|uniref:CAP domain-containing protein n=1 Tax=uncultured Tateyamaria sp. TaxID=455651 RepID=UPI002602473C|nr:CAP domain-containing protein [uncultured Tateyamaria sp.]
MRNWIVAAVVCASGAAADPAVLAAVNAERAAAGLPAVGYNATLEAAARAHGEDMAANGFFDHAGSDGSDLADRLDRAGYAYCFGAENIAMGQRSLPEVMAGWMGSPGHRANILHARAQEVAVARVTGNRWVMVLGAPC